MSVNDGKTRLQIPVREEFANYVGSLAACLRWSQSRMAEALLEEAVESREKVLNWLGERLIASFANAARGKSRVHAEGEPSVYLQTYVSPALNEKISRLAADLNNTPVRTAALLLESGAHDNDWIINALGSGPGRALAEFLRPAPRRRAAVAKSKK